MLPHDGRFASVSGRPGLRAEEVEVRREMQICNACRYCEGFCAVFPAMTRRLEFAKEDIHYLANLCHNCGACLHACQYAPPHEFGVNVPRAMARVRRETYAEFAWPRALGALYRRNGLALSAVLTITLALFVIAGVASRGGLWGQVSGGDFYALIPHGLMVALFTPPFLFAILALGIGVAKFWRDQSPGRVTGDAAGEATVDALRLRYLDGGHGEGCNNEDDRFSHSRRLFHHLTFYGFALCFAATSVATVYHYVFDWRAPYELLSLPKLLGVTGGISMVVGCLGLFTLNLRRHPLQQEASQRGMDCAFVLLLLLTAVTGLVLMAVRTIAAMPLLLALHLGSVMALFVTLPYGKFAHAVYRVAALLKWAIERRLPNPIDLRGD